MPYTYTADTTATAATPSVGVSTSGSSRTAASTSVGVWGCALVAGLISFVNFMK